jgi:hypothetical protein
MHPPLTFHDHLGPFALAPPDNSLIGSNRDFIYHRQAICPPSTLRDKYLR